MLHESNHNAIVSEDQLYAILLAHADLGLNLEFQSVMEVALCRRNQDWDNEKKSGRDVHMLDTAYTGLHWNPDMKWRAEPSQVEGWSVGTGMAQLWKKIDKD